ncbi:DUF3168 domain-containing protein [Sedimentitalea todarodis]|uniref:DUF3168 domain-containing protein n=1 Tax=Sedimentitalea todarodis TaxID=1631240 RepID=A0ABU3VCI7_9RHOB|nr:DUF3168 domain-containing protein [Sedimentitalea todarodis]MDU9003893.1 DUF3168 domain-containing protein [Sedimentitalea todarodis]
MSYAMAGALQAAVYQHLLADPGVNALVGNAIFDALPAGDLPDVYVAIGTETVRDRSDTEGAGAEHRFTVSVVTDASGFGEAKAVAGAVSDALSGATPSLSRGRVVGFWFERAQARRTGRAGRVRQIDLRFRARLEDN